MKKKYEELFERLKKERGAALFDEDGCLKWNSIDYTQRSWLEVPRKGEPPLYLEREDGLNVLAVDAAVPDLMDEYGENHFPEEAEEDERLVSKATLEARHGDDYDFDSYVKEEWGLKTEAEIREDLERPVQGVLAQSPEGNAIADNALGGVLAKMKIKTLGDLLLADPAETEDKLASMGASASIFLRLSYMAESFGYDWGSGLVDAALELAKEEWKASYLKAASDGLIDPAETWALRDLAERLSLDSDDCAKIEEECLPSLDGKKPLKSVWLATRAEGFSGWFERNKFEAAKSFAAENGGLVPAFGDVSSAADTLVRTLMYGGKSAHACYGANKFWIEDNETREVKEASLPEIVALAERIAEENEQPLHKEIIASAFRPKEILLPVDVSYVFRLPEGTYPDYRFTFFDKSGHEGERPVKRSVDVIRGCFQWPSNVVELKQNWVNGRHKIIATFRHYIAVSKETDYRNLNYAEIEDKLQALVGAALNEAFGTNKEILFDEVKASRPEKFISQKTGRDVVVDEIEAKKFTMTSEEYSLSLDLEKVKAEGSTVAEKVKRFMTDKADYEAVLDGNPTLKKWAESVVQEVKKKTAKPAMKVFNVIPKEVWNEEARKNPDKVPEAMSDVYQIEVDKSGQSGILHFSHELSLSFDLDESGKPRFLLGDEIAAEFIEYSKDDWDYLKERFPGIDREVSEALEEWLKSDRQIEEPVFDMEDKLDYKTAKSAMRIMKASGALELVGSEDSKAVRDAVEDAVRAFYERTSLSAKGKCYEVGEDHGAISDYLTDVLFNGAGPRVVKSAEDPSELIDSLREAFANELDISFPNGRFYVQPEGDKFARTVEGVPVWAVPYLAYGESDSLTEEDRKLADEFMESHGFGKLIDASNTYSEHTYFRSHPAFGPACDCVDANFSLKEAAREIKDSKEIEFRSKEEIFEDFVKRVKDGLSGANRKAVSAVLSAAKAALASFPDGEKTAIGEFLSKKGAKDEESLKKILGSTGRKEKSAGRGRKPPEMSR